MIGKREERNRMLVDCLDWFGRKGRTKRRRKMWQTLDASKGKKEKGRMEEQENLEEKREIMCSWIYSWNVRKGRNEKERRKKNDDLRCE